MQQDAHSGVPVALPIFFTLFQLAWARWIRHPMYAAKLILGAATIVSSCSLWFVPTTVYFYAATLRAMFREDQQFGTSLPEYRDYQRHTHLLVPGLI